MKPFLRFYFFVTRGAATANGLAEFTAVGNSCCKDCPRVRVSWYSSTLPWSHRNPSPSNAAKSQKKLSTSNRTLRTVRLSPKKARSTGAQTVKPWDSCPNPHSKFPDSFLCPWQKTWRWDFYVSGVTAEAGASELGLSSSVLFQSNLN